MESYRPYLDWIDSQQQPMVELLHKWANVNTGTYNPAGLEILADLIAAEFRRDCESIQFRDPGPHEIVDAHGHVHSPPLGRNLHMIQRPRAPLQVLLAIHMDTVYGVESTFQTVEQLDENTLRGPGVADAKGGIVVLLHALRALENFLSHQSNSQPQLGWEVIINSDEEIGSPGSTALFQEAAQRVHLGLLFEPSLPEGKLVSSRKGSGNFAIVAHGRAAHSGRDFHHGRNAVVAAAEVTSHLHRLTSRWEEMTLNVARIDGGGPSNMVPAVAVIRLNIRYADSRHENSILSAIHQILDQVSRHSEVRFELHGHFSSPPKPLDLGLQTMLHQFQSCGAALGLNVDWAPSGGACDGNRLAACGIPNIDALGPRGGRIHSHEEFISIDSLAERARLTALFLMQLADGTLQPPPPSSPNA